jgi:hypothetical protein
MIKMLFILISENNLIINFIPVSWIDNKHFPKVKSNFKQSSFDLECVWYCGSCCDCGLKKVVL